MNKNCYLVICPGYWGRGATVKMAAEAAIKAGARRTDKASLRLIVGDEDVITKTLFNGTHICRPENSQKYDIATNFTLGMLARTNEIAY